MVAVACIKYDLPSFLKGNDCVATKFPIQTEGDDDDDGDNGIDVAPAA
nr:IRON MAN 2 [Lotus japonicus]